MQSAILTKEGFKKLVEKKENLLQDRPIAVKELSKAREMGDLSENGFYKGARFKLSQIDRELRKISRILKNVKIIEKPKDMGSVFIGSKVTIENNGKISEFTIVGQEEANPKERKISHLSPIGRGILGKKVGETAEISVPSGISFYKIIKIS